MTPTEFDRLASLLQGQHGAARDAARLVLVGGESVTHAAFRCNITRGAVYRVVRRIRELQVTGCPLCGQEVRT